MPICSPAVIMYVRKYFGRGSEYYNSELHVSVGIAVWNFTKKNPVSSSTSYCIFCSVRFSILVQMYLSKQNFQTTKVRLCDKVLLVVCVCVCVHISFSNFRGYLRTFSNDFTTRNSAIGAITCVRNLKRQSDNVTSI